MTPSKAKVKSSLARSAAPCGSMPLSLSCQLSSEGNPSHRAVELSRLTTGVSSAATASLTLVSVEDTLPVLMIDQSEEAIILCVRSAFGEGFSVCGLSVEAAEGKATAARKASEGEFGGVWKKSEGEPEGRQWQETKRSRQWMNPKLNIWYLLKSRFLQTYVITVHSLIYRTNRLMQQKPLLPLSWQEKSFPKGILCMLWVFLAW